MDLLVLALMVSACGWTGHGCQLGEAGLPAPRPVVFTQAPVYKEPARRARIQAGQWVAVKIRPDGTVESAEAEGRKVPMGLGLASEDAARLWRFAPASQEQTLRLYFEFRLADRCNLKAPFAEKLSAYSFRVWSFEPEMPTYVFTNNGCYRKPQPPCPEDGTAQPPS